MRFIIRLVARHFVLLTIIASIWMIYIFVNTSDKPLVRVETRDTAPAASAPTF